MTDDYRFFGHLHVYLEKLKPVWGELQIVEVNGLKVIVGSEGGLVATFRPYNQDSFGEFGHGELAL